MGFFDFNFLKEFNISSFFKFEKKSQTLVKNTNQTNLFLMNDSQVAKDIITNLPQFRQNNVNNIISKAEENIKSKDKSIKSPEAEWLGPFIDYSKDVSDKKLQNIWSEILEGKVNNKNTSIRTLSVLRKINSSEANLFNRFLNYNIDSFVYYKENKMPKGFPTFSEISLLLEIGLVKQMSNVVRIIKPVMNPVVNIVLNPVMNNIGVLGTYYGYLLYVSFKSEQKEIKIPSVFLSKAGIELSQFVNHERDNRYLSCLSQFLKSNNLQLKAVSIPKQSEEGKTYELNFNQGQDIN